MQRTKWTMDERESSSSSFSARPRAFGFSGIDVRTNPDVKNVKREFSSLFDAYLPDDDGDDAVTTLAYFGNVDVGRDVLLSALRSTHDVVILAYGTQSSDRRQGIPGSGDGELDGVLSAREFVVWYNGQYSTSLWPLLVSAYQKVVETDGGARVVIRDQFDILPGMGHHNRLGDDAKSADHGAGIVCRWWHRRGSHLLRRVEDAGLVCASRPSTAPSLWSSYVGCHSLHRYRLALLLGFEILREEFVPQYRCLHLMHAISRGCTVSWAFSFSCQTFYFLFFVLNAGQPTFKMKSFVVELATCGMGKY